MERNRRVAESERDDGLGSIQFQEEKEDDRESY